ncbi:hypothetical protein KGA66_18620 [Actinocrinis puniceicyclus]|uniref:Uncharacterized protein n=1 Tax=Actinocrinis puniceicyclus TaxID=977794 RepID=A0A8J8BDB6_9ACTN|nr:hypothetical protein [Actinocrinis puniceicyclus]MBS2965078.1 hypothetical protein [Actinocrinis puniceicyclus]
MTVDSVQALLIDEDEENLTALPERLRHPFARLGWQLAWTTAKDPRQARELFSVPGAVYDLIVVDLPAAAPDGPGGPGGQAEPAVDLRLIRDARDRFPGAYIVVIGSGEAQSPDLLEEARRCGAHRALRRYEFSVEARENSPAAIAADIHNHLLDTGAVAPIAVTYDEYDPHIQAFVHAIGEPTLCRLYARILQAAGRTTRNMSLGYIASGCSGAAVCAVTAALDNSGVRTHHVLKVSLDKEALEREAHRGTQVLEMVRPALLARQSPPYPVGPVNGWYALASQLQGAALTLREWLARGAADAAVEDVFAALFTDGLGGLYADTAQEIDSPADLLRTPYYRQRRVLHTVKQFAPVLAHPDGCRLPEPTVEELTDRVAAFVAEGRIGAMDAQRLEARRTCATYSHGQLHGKNVLVYEGRHPEPTVIDASRFHLAHWATDPALLAVDLLMHSVDPGAESMFFTGFERWRALAARLGRMQPLLRAPSAADPAAFPPVAPATDGRRGKAEPDGAAGLAALDWLTGNLRAFCPGLSGESEYRAHAWEWHTALARDLLRASYDQEATVPKRALAIVAAYDQLAAAEGCLPD